MLLAVVDILLKIKNIVSSEEVAAVSTLYNPRRRCGGSCCALAAAYNKRRRWRSRLRGVSSLETKFEHASPTCVLTRFLPRALSVSGGVESEGSAVGTGSASVVFDGPGSLMYGPACS